MNDSLPSGTATEQELAQLVQRLNGDGDGDLAAIDALLTLHTHDARLHFLRGSILAGSGRALLAHQSLTRAVELAPDFAIARFQLGFFELTSGEPGSALENWARLDQLPTGHYLRFFVEGLRALIADDFGGCIAQLELGIASNVDNPPLSNDMRLIIEQCRTLNGANPRTAADSDTVEQPTDARSNDQRDDAREDISAAALLLNRFGVDGSRH